MAYVRFSLLNRELEASNREHQHAFETLKTPPDLLEEKNKILWWKVFLLGLKTRREPVMTVSGAQDTATSAAGGRSRGLLSEPEAVYCAVSAKKVTETGHTLIDPRRALPTQRSCAHRRKPLRVLFSQQLWSPGSAIVKEQYPVLLRLYHRNNCIF